MESTKTGAVMGLVSREVTATAVEEGFAGEGPAHRALISEVVGHPLFEQLSQKPGDTCIPAGRFDSGPACNIFLKGDGYIAELRFRW